MVAALLVVATLAAIAWYAGRTDCVLHQNRRAFNRIQRSIQQRRRNRTTIFVEAQVLYRNQVASSRVETDRSLRKCSQRA